MISVIIPVFNRIELVKCCLLCLTRGTILPDEVVIVDDGSEDGMLSVVRNFMDGVSIPFKYLFQRWSGVTPGHARNAGVKLAEGNVIVFLDSHIITARDWLESFVRIHNEYPDAIVCGRYDWLPNMKISVEEVMMRFEDVIEARYEKLPMRSGPMVGPDPRWWNDKIREKKRPGKRFGLGMFSGNLLMPRELFVKSGGFDESLVKPCGEDGELGLTLEEMGARALFTEKPMGWHLYHGRDEELYKAGMRPNIEYIMRKHDLKKHGIKISPNYDFLYYEDGTFVPELMEKSIRRIMIDGGLNDKSL